MLLQLSGSQTDRDTLFPGVWQFTFYLGNFVGPTAGGHVVEARGFRFATGIFCACFVVLAAANLAEAAFLFFRGRRRRIDEE